MTGSRSRLRLVPVALRVLPVALLLGCASQLAVLQPVDEYDQYRKVRLSENFERRLAEGWAYLRRYPDGAWRAEVRTWFEPAEERYRRQAWDSPPRLHGYLRVLPDGPYAAHVRARIAQLESRARSSAAEETSFMRRERERQQRFDLAQQTRGRFLREISLWLERLSKLRDFGDLPLDWDEEFRTRFLEAEPPASCDSARCEKELHYEFDLPTHDGFITRTANLRVVVELENDGRMQSVALEGYELWSRLGESASLRSVELDQLQARAEALGSAVQLAGRAIELGFPAARCDAEAISPDLLVRRCDGLEFVMTSAEDFASPEGMIVRRSGAVAGDTGAVSPASPAPGSSAPGEP